MDFLPDRPRVVDSAKAKRAKRRVDYRRKNLRDALPRLHKDYKEDYKEKKNKKNVYPKDIDGEVS